MFNLGLLTSDGYAVLYAFLLRDSVVPWLYVISFALVVVGLALYHSIPSTTTAETVALLPSVADEAASAATSLLTGRHERQERQETQESEDQHHSESQRSVPSKSAQPPKRAELGDGKDVRYAPVNQGP
jgi:hypothetical protein